MAGPKCPNHDVQLILTDTPGIGICPVSDARFEYEEVKDEKSEDAGEELVIENGKYVKRKKRKFKIVKGDEDAHDYNVH